MQRTLKPSQCVQGQDYISRKIVVFALCENSPTGNPPASKILFQPSSRPNFTTTSGLHKAGGGSLTRPSGHAHYPAHNSHHAHHPAGNNLPYNRDGPLAGQQPQPNGYRNSNNGNGYNNTGGYGNHGSNGNSYGHAQNSSPSSSQYGHAHSGPAAAPAQVAGGGPAGRRWVAPSKTQRGSNRQHPADEYQFQTTAQQQKQQQFNNSISSSSNINNSSSNNGQHNDLVFRKVPRN